MPGGWFNDGAIAWSLEKMKNARKERSEVIYGLEKCGERERRVLGK
jgi:hypothetical protein